MNVVDRNQKASSRSPSGPAARDLRHARFYIGARNGLVDEKHIGAMGMSVWLFLWCLGRQTTPAGDVLGGKEIRYQEIARELGQPTKTIRNWADCLRNHRYIGTARGKRGLVWQVLHPKKFRHYQRSLFQDSPDLGAHGAECPDLGSPDLGTLLPKNGHSGSRIINEVLEGRQSRNERVKNARSSAASLAGGFQKVAAENWALRYEGGKPTWGAAEFTLLAKIANTHQELGLEALIQVWGNFLASTDRFITDRGHSPKDFWSRFDRLRQGPILERGGGRKVPTAKPNGGGGKFDQYNRKAADL